MNKRILIVILFTTLKTFAFQQMRDTATLTPVEQAVQQRMQILNQHIAIHNVSPNNPEETILVIPKAVNEEEDTYELNTHIFIIDNKTGKTTHSYFESSETNGWTSDAIFIDQIVIDTTGYQLNPSKSAFGIKITWRGMSQPNPYTEERISLYTKEKDSLTKVLDLFPIYESIGEVNVNACYAKFNKTKNELSVGNSKTNGYYDILVNITTSEELFQEDEHGECNPKEKVITTKKEVLKFNQESYSKSENVIHAKVDSVSMKEVKFLNIGHNPTIYDYYKVEELDEVEIWSEKMFGRCCSEADLEYSELLVFKIMAKTYNEEYPFSNLSDTRYRFAYVFTPNDTAQITLKLDREDKWHTTHTSGLGIDDVLTAKDTLLSPFKLSLVNGYAKSEKTFQENGRVKALKVFLNDTYQGTVELLDTPDIQQFELDFPFFKNDEVTLVPVSFYKGTKYEDICISEIQSSFSQIAHPSINKKYKVLALREKGHALKKNKE